MKCLYFRTTNPVNVGEVLAYERTNLNKLFLAYHLEKIFNGLLLLKINGRIYP